ncbi:MAG: F0F1 ATP synthase subunit A [Azospirillaceae bacterium]
MASPIEQFEIHPILPIEVGGVDLSFTNSSLWMVIAVVLSTLVLSIGIRGRALVPNRMQSLAEMLYEIVANMIRDNVGRDGRRYFPFIFTLFIFVLFANLLGMIPIAFTVTSHLIVTFTLAAVVFVAVTILGFARHGLGYLRMFFPHGAPLWTAVILVPVELVSYLSRPISLSVRLFANMTVGHVLLKVIAGFVVALGVAGIFPLGFLVALTALELFIAVLQAYVFTILTCIYLHDALHMH